VPLYTSSVRRSSRFSKEQDQPLLELEDNPRKKQRVWREISYNKQGSRDMLRKPPVPTDDGELFVMLLLRS
jgi:hypothetical protein